jgi:hypothetical protein
VRVAAGLGACLLLAHAPAAAALTGREWQRLPEAARGVYVTGVVDAWTGLVAVQESLNARDVAITVIGDVVRCLRDRLIPAATVEALVARYVETHPGLAGKDMPDIVFAVMAEHCRR